MTEDRLEVSFSLGQVHFLSSLLNNLLSLEGAAIASSIPPGTYELARDVYQTLIDAAILEGKIDVADLPPPREDIDG